MAIYVISGGTSFLGRHLIAQLLEQQHIVYVIARPESKNLSILSTHPNCRVILSDIAQVNQWKRSIPRADFFLHLAWAGEGMKGRADLSFQKKNIETSLACMQCAAELGIKRFIFFGSQAEYGLQSVPVDEGSLCAPITEYGKAKHEFGELARPLAQKLGIGYVHLRIFSVYGPGDHPWTLVNTCLDGFLNGQEVSLSSCEQPWNFLYIKDFVRAVTALCESPAELANGIFNIAGDETLPLREYIDVIWRLCANKGRPLFGTVNDRIERPYGIMPINSKLHRTTDWNQQVSFEAGIREMISARCKEETR